MSQGKPARHVLLATLMGKRPRGRPRTKWSDYISELAWTSLGVESAKLSDIAVDREVFPVLLAAAHATLQSAHVN